MPNASRREWRFYLDDMIDFARKVLASTEGLDHAGFLASELAYDATLRNLELIGSPPPIFRTKSVPPIPKFPGE
ncbi:MAG TPA: hypothetical protein PLI53_10040 [Geobacteraceae bacterium]|nr:hypothetical protein [Geobacteraceae bacterium]